MPSSCLQISISSGFMYLRAAGSVSHTLRLCLALATACSVGKMMSGASPALYGEVQRPQRRHATVGLVLLFACIRASSHVNTVQTESGHAHHALLHRALTEGLSRAIDLQPALTALVLVMVTPPGERTSHKHV